MMTFDEGYQKELLARMINKKFMDMVGTLIQADMFDPDLEPVAKDMLGRWRKGKKVLSKGQFQQLCGKFKVGHIGTAPSSGDHDFDAEEVLSFARDRVLREAGVKFQVYREQGKYERAVQSVSECWSQLPHLNHKAVDILKERTPIPRRKGLCELGLPKIDGWLQGGIAAGDLGIIMAPTSGGKTSFLVYLATEALKQGKKIGYVTLEVPSYEIEAKIRRNLCEKIEPRGKEWVTAANKLSRKGGVSRIWEFPPHTVSVNEIDQQIPPEIELLFIDYGDYLRSSSGNSGLDYRELGSIYSGLKRIGLQRGIPVWSASQVNRAAYEKDRLDLQDVELSLQKVMTADQVLTILQRGVQADPDSEGNTSAKIYIAKNRHGSRFQEVSVMVNWALCQFVEWE